MVPGVPLGYMRLAVGLISTGASGVRDHETVGAWTVQISDTAIAILPGAGIPYLWIQNATLEHRPRGPPRAWIRPRNAMKLLT